MNVISRPLLTSYLEELASDEQRISEAAAQYAAIKARLEVGLRRYTALRDFVTDQLGKSPYTPGVDWPGEAEDWLETRGQFRFTGMRVGEAILQVLEEEDAQFPNNPWLERDQIVERLSLGGLGFPEPVRARVVTRHS